MIRNFPRKLFAIFFMIGIFGTTVIEEQQQPFMLNHLPLNVQESIQSTRSVNQIRITGSVQEVPVSENSANWNVAVLRDGNFLCSGTLINHKTVVTVAHCITGFENKPHGIAVRHSSLVYDSGSTIDVIKINRHPLYNALNFDYDVATLFLDQSIPSNITTLKVTQFEASDSLPLIIYGWGSSDPSSSTLQKRLMTTTMRKTTQTDCQYLWNGVNEITARMICALGSASMCHGDEGGPVVQNVRLVGIMSYGYPCSASQYPNVFTNVAAVRNWILNNQLN